MNLKARIKQRAAKAKAVNAQLMGSFLSAHVPTAGSFANAGQSVSSDHLFEKYAEAKRWVDSKELEFMSSQSAIMIANALNSVEIPKKKSWFSRIFGA